MLGAGGGSESSGESLWRFSLALYARSGVAASLIALQDRANCDVNLVLFALWLGAVRGRSISATELAAAASAATATTTIALQARTWRRGLRSASAEPLQTLRRRLLMFELAAERAVQQQLATCGATASVDRDRLAAADANLAVCLREEAGSSEAGALRAALAALTRRA